MVKKKVEDTYKKPANYKSQLSAQLYCSPLESKKYRVIFYEDGKKTKHIDFGASKYNDYTIYNETEGKTEADKHRDNYIARHKPSEYTLWETDPMSRAALSRWILWEKPTLEQSFNFYKNKFGIQ
jgi:hypothetical protein